MKFSSPALAGFAQAPLASLTATGFGLAISGVDTAPTINFEIFEIPDGGYLFTGPETGIGNATYPRQSL